VEFEWEPREADGEQGRLVVVLDKSTVLIHDVIAGASKRESSTEDWDEATDESGEGGSKSVISWHGWTINGKLPYHPFHSVLNSMSSKFVRVLSSWSPLDLVSHGRVN
jgi:hypothetical protein